MNKLKKLLQDLADTKLIKITGSYADGTQTDISDIDFYIKPNKPEQEFYKRNMLKIIKILNKYNIKWNSTSTGYIHTHRLDYTLPVFIEFSDLFKPRKNKLKNVIIEGIKFKTY